MKGRISLQWKGSQRERRGVEISKCITVLLGVQSGPTKLPKGPIQSETTNSQSLRAEEESAMDIGRTPK